MPGFRFDFDFLRNRYDYELQRKEQLTAALTLPVAVLSALGGAIVAMARSFSYLEPLLTWSFGTILAAEGFAFVACLAYLARAYHRQTYVFLPMLGEIDKSREEFLEFAPAMAGGEAEVIEAFETQMRQRMIEAADRNTQTSDERSGLLHRARLALYAVLVLTAAAGIPYVIDQVSFYYATAI
ncbi:MAG: hypothetical protein A3J29_08875 [Acidobacteria bacterium RIFCSPLOWO2_12_FULL_67_14b]|nr:MAG: hypothetical protein A3J29_08875 [Acidobacteria bacterium RIFCSPLOWO2_12_FULL_67_14b]